MDLQQCGAFIRRCRTERGLSQQQLANELHVTREAVSKWENGRGLPDVSLLQPLARALGVSVNALLLGEEGARDEEALNTWIFLTEAEQALRRRSSTRLLLAVAAVIAAQFVARGALALPLRALLYALAVGLPLALALKETVTLGSLVTSSYACCFTAVLLELMQIRRRVLAQDWSGLSDTIDVSAALCVGLILAALLANALVLSGRKH